MTSPISSALQYLISVFFSFALYSVLLRFLLQWARADFYNPISQFLVKLTNPAVIPLRRVIPGYGGIDIASLVLAFCVALVELLLLYGVLLWSVPSLPGTLLMAGVQVMSSVVNIFFFAIIIQAIMSWVNPSAFHSPVGHVLTAITEPVLSPARQLMPALSGIDLSPLFVIIGIQLCKILLITPLEQYATLLMLVPKTAYL